MSCELIDGNKIASELYGGIKERIAALKVRGCSLCLAFILLGNDPASEVYAKMKYKKCVELGIGSMTFRLPEDTTEEMLLKKIDELNADPSIQGILIQLPLPKHINENKITNAIDPMKDVDCLHPHNVGRILIGNPIILPATPAGIQQLLIRSGVETASKHVVILGRSNIVGKPLAAMLLQEGKGADSTVTVVHSMTKNLADITNQADILVSSLGKPGSITADMIKEGAIVIDVGINRISDPSSSKGTKLVGDVEVESVIKKASMLTPVPGGVGPMTIYMLMNNMVTMVEHQLGC
ncbi:MAG: bifunctional 5,10-methylene-tetrahydrofolate dehydrogenase/5,10-methylene-tetrahydrofolate cyclohydrolase [archaeon]|nr:bifunctional 5,10-methylene-tetrahydrofolate dehydrogenase/5,10-methylene-tetrahydrofolate cyclohydrolase [archaeon]